MTIRPPMPIGSADTEENACEKALEGAFLDVAAHARAAGWGNDEVARALLRLAGAYVLMVDGEHDRAEAIATIRQTLQ